MESTDPDVSPGRRAVAAPAWRWLPGMLVVHPDATFRQRRIVDTQDEVPVGWLPHLGDPATLGCLLELVRVAHADPTITPYVGERSRLRTVSWWEVAGPTSRRVDEHGQSYLGADVWRGATEAEALVAALEAGSDSTEVKVLP